MRHGIGKPLAAAAFLLAAAGHARASPPPAAPTSASAPAAQSVVTDIAHWRHPAKAVFAKYEITLTKVAVQDGHPKFWVIFPFNPQAGPNEATMRALYLDLLKADGESSYSLVADEYHLEIRVLWDKKARKIKIEEANSNSWPQ